MQRSFEKNRDWGDQSLNIGFRCLQFYFGNRIERAREERSGDSAFLIAISSLKGLSVFRPTVSEMADAAKTMKTRRLDFDDSYVVSAMKAEGVKTLVSFDRHFDKQVEVKRLEPNKILERMESLN